MPIQRLSLKHIQNIESLFSHFSMQLVKGNSRSTISTQGDYHTKILVLSSHSLRTFPKQIFQHQKLILIMERHHKNKCENNPFMNLGAETILQSQGHNRGQTTLRQDFASISSRHMACDFSPYIQDKMSIQRYLFQKLKL